LRTVREDIVTVKTTGHGNGRNHAVQRWGSLTLFLISVAVLVSWTVNSSGQSWRDGITPSVHLSAPVVEALLVVLVLWQMLRPVIRALSGKAASEKLAAELLDAAARGKITFAWADGVSPDDLKGLLATADENWRAQLALAFVALLDATDDKERQRVPLADVTWPGGGRCFAPDLVTVEETINTNAAGHVAEFDLCFDRGALGPASVRVHFWSTSSILHTPRVRVTVKSWTGASESAQVG
jgi:hypothetical protein